MTSLDEYEEPWVKMFGAILIFGIVGAGLVGALPYMLRLLFALFVHY